MLLRKLEKLETNLGGVAQMRKLPDAVMVIDLGREALAVREARRCGIPVIGLVDTNCDPDEADYVIPGNDDAIKSCQAIVSTLADAVAEGRSLWRKAEDEAAAAAAAAAEAARGRRCRRGRRPPPLPQGVEEEAPAPAGEAPRERLHGIRRRGQGPARGHRRRHHGVQERAARGERRPGGRRQAAARARHREDAASAPTAPPRKA